MRIEQLHEPVLLRPSHDAFQVEQLAEVGLGRVAAVDEVCLDQTLGRDGADLERFEERVELGHGGSDALDEGRRGLWW